MTDRSKLHTDLELLANVRPTHTRTPGGDWQALPAPAPRAAAELVADLLQALAESPLFSGYAMPEAACVAYSQIPPEALAQVARELRPGWHASEAARFEHLQQDADNLRLQFAGLPRGTPAEADRADSAYDAAMLLYRTAGRFKFLHETQAHRAATIAKLTSETAELVAKLRSISND